MSASIKCEWFYGNVQGPKTPQGFHVYVGTSGSPSYGSPVATVPYSAGFMNSFQTILTGLTGGLTYSIGVRAFNAFAEEQNTVFVNCLADDTPPLPPVNLTGAVVSQG